MNGRDSLVGRGRLVVIIIRIQQEASLRQSVAFPVQPRYRDNRKTHLACPGIHDSGNVELVTNRFGEALPQLLHVCVAELVRGHVALEGRKTWTNEKARN